MFSLRFISGFSRGVNEGLLPSEFLLTTNQSCVTSKKSEGFDFVNCSVPLNVYISYIIYFQISTIFLVLLK